MRNTDIKMFFWPWEVERWVYVNTTEKMAFRTRAVVRYFGFTRVRVWKHDNEREALVRATIKLNIEKLWKTKSID